MRVLAHNTLLPAPSPSQPTISADQWYRIVVEREIVVAPEQVKHALDIYAGIQFWNAKNKGETTDGSDWIIESRVHGKYRLVDFRNEPSQSARDFGLYLVNDLGGLAIPKDAIY